jgi:hypothetical protein
MFASSSGSGRGSTHVSASCAIFSEVAPILLGRVGDETLNVVGEIGNEETPHADVDKVENEGTPHVDVDTPDEDEDEHDGDAHGQREIEAEILEVGAAILGVDDKIKFETASAEILDLLDLALLGLGGTTFAICPNVIVSVDVLPSLPMFSANALNMLWVDTGAFGLAVIIDESCRGLGVRLCTPLGQPPLEAPGHDAHGSAAACAASIHGVAEAVLGGGAHAEAEAALGGQSGH